MSAPAAGRWLIVPRIATGTRHLALQLGRWHAGRPLTGWARARAVAGRAIGGAAVTWFAGGMLWALGTPPWAIVPLWLAVALAVSYRDTPAEPELTAAAFTELLHDVARGGNVHLVAIREQLAKETGRPWSGPEVRALCDTVGIRVRDGVRVPGATPAVTTGIHRDDLPPLPQGRSGTPVGAVGAGQHANNNTNTPETEEIGGGAAVIIKTGPSTRQEAHR